MTPAGKPNGSGHLAKDFLSLKGREKYNFWGSWKVIEPNQRKSSLSWNSKQG